MRDTYSSKYTCVQNMDQLLIIIYAEIKSDKNKILKHF